MSASGTSDTGDAAAPLGRLPRHRHALSRADVLGSQTGRLLLATASAVSELGYANTTVAEIIRRAGVSRKTFYEVFADREAAVLAVFTGVEHMLSRVTAATMTHEDPVQMIRGALRVFLDALAAQPEFTRMLIIEAPAAGPRIRQRRNQAVRDFAAAVTARVNEVRERHPGYAPTSPDLVVGALGGVLEVCAQHLSPGEVRDLPALLPTLSTLMESVLVRPEH